MSRSRRSLLAATLPTLLLATLLALLPAGIRLDPAVAQEATPAAVPVLDLSGSTPARFDATMQAALDAYAATLAGEYGIVGASVGITQDGEVVFSRGYGVREFGGTEQVNPETRFMIGSVTKSMTSMLAATVVDDGLASWNTPLADLIPGFALSDPALAARVTLADSFCACTGLPRDDTPLLMNPAPSAAEELARMNRIAVLTPFGESFNYSNQMYAAGGYAATFALGGLPDSLGSDYDDAMQDRILNPIGMTDSTFRFDEVLDSRNYATPHSITLAGDTVPLSLLQEKHFVGPIAPAGALWSTAPDMARYLATQLNNGIAPDGRRVVSAENLDRTHQQGVAITLPDGIPLPPSPLGESYAGYALGWLTGSWNGLPLISHSGGTLGFSSEAAMLPEANAGIVILTNGGLNAGAFNLAVQYRFFELLYGLEPQAAPVLDAQVETARSAFADLAAVAKPADPAAIAPFAGVYHHPDLGEVRITTDDEAATVVAGVARTRLAPAPASVTASATPAADGVTEQRYISLDPPFAGPNVVIVLRETADGSREIEIDVTDERQHSYVLDAVP